jgi:hypothetical protein
MVIGKWLRVKLTQPLYPYRGISPKGENRKACNMPNDLVRRLPKNKTQAIQLAPTINSPSPFRGKLEGGPHGA